MKEEYKWISQDSDGFIKAFRTMKPKLRENGNWECGEASDWDCKQCSKHGNFAPIKINISKHDYKIEDGLLIKLDKHTEAVKHALKNAFKENPNRHKHADLMIAYANDKSLQIQYMHAMSKTWMDAADDQLWDVSFEYRIKPKTKTVRFRNYLNKSGQVKAINRDLPVAYFDKWIGDWQEVEVTE